MNKLALIPLIALAGCASTPDFAGYDTAVYINKMVNSKTTYRYADRPKGYLPTEVMKPGGSGNCADFAVVS